MNSRGVFRRLFRVPLSAPEQAARDIDEEFRLHLELRTEEFMAEGMSEEEARAEAQRVFGDEERARRALIAPERQRLRRQRAGEWLADVARDIRFGTRSLLRSPAFTIIAVLTLGLGIGANTALFSVVDAVLLEPLPFPNPAQLVMVFESHADRGPDDRNVANPGNYNDWKKRARSFSSMSAIMSQPRTVRQGEEPREVPSQVVDADFFRTLGVPPKLGRTFTVEESKVDPSQVAVIGEQFWRRHFNGDPSVVGREIDMMTRRVRVIGVMPASVEVFTGDVAFWLPSDFSWGNRTSMGRFITVIARVADGATPEDADREMVKIAADLRREDPAFNEKWSTNVVPLTEHLQGDVRLAMLVVLGAVGVLLLIACANVANLLLVRAATRRTEIAVRASLGAGRARIARGLMIESMVLAIAGGALGVGIAFGATRALVAGVPASLNIPRLANASVDPSVLLFAACAALVTGILFGLAPVMEAFRTNLASGLREGSRGAGGSTNARRTRGALVVAEIALSLVLLAGAGLLLRSFVALQRTDLGFQTDGVVTGRVSLNGPRYQEGAARVAFFQQAVETLRNEPGVKAAGMLWWLPLSGSISATGYYRGDRPKPGNGEMSDTQVQAVEGDIFDVLRIPLVNGRKFDARDREGAARVVIVNRLFAAKTWPGENPLGKHVIMPWDIDLDMQVVGVVGDAHHDGVQQPAVATLYIPHAQFAQFSTANIMVRTEGNTTPIERVMAERIHTVDPNLAVTDVQPLRTVVSAAVMRPRLTSLLVGIFAALALLLAAIGIYGVVSYSVALRSREMGVRRALGAQTTDVARMVMGDAMRLGGAGISIGVLGAIFATRVLKSLLYDVAPGDPLVFGATAFTLLAVTAIAAFIPAMRAARVSPTEAIRHE